jgi:tripartite-type tricarboxylate transporter receptor subunit TctC
MTLWGRIELAFAGPIRLVLLSSLVVAATGAARAQESISKFYSSNPINIYVGEAPGASYDIYGRLMSMYLGRYIPGSPQVIVRNMPGAGGLVMTNWLYNAAPRDGTAIAIAFQGTAVEQRLSSAGIQYDAGRFSWIGRISPVTEVTYTWYKSPTKSLADATRRQTIIGGSGPTAPSIWYLRVLNALAGTKFKAIPGFEGGNVSLMAMESGEIEGTSKAWATLKAGNPDLLRDHKLNILVQYGPERDPDLPNVPLLMDVGRSPDQKAALRFFTFGDAMGRSVVGPPNIPPDRLAALRKAFVRAMADPRLQSFAAKIQLQVGPPLGSDGLDQIVKDTLETSDKTAALAKAARGGF